MSLLILWRVACKNQKKRANTRVYTFWYSLKLSFSGEGGITSFGRDPSWVGKLNAQLRCRTVHFRLSLLFASRTDSLNKKCPETGH